MSMPREKRPVIKMERGQNRLLPGDFTEILFQRYAPVLSLTYISSVIGIAAQKGPIIEHVLGDRSVYVMALFVALWISIPGILWIFLKGTHLYHHLADDWYKIIAILMLVTLGLSYVLFPEMDALGLRTIMAATIPMLLVMYWFFVKGGLPALAAHPLSVLGLTFFFYGATIGMFH